MRGLMLVLAVMTATACDEKFTGPTTPLDTAFVLGPGETAAVEQTELKIRFDRVANDSRCPADAFCIQGGDAQVRITVSGVGATREYDLHTGSMQPVTHGAFIIHLVQLAPYPFSSRTIAPGDYRATLRVTR
jgi:hypothetical protein